MLQVFRQTIFDGCHGDYGEGVDDHVHGHHLDQDGCQFLRYDADPAYGVSEQELGRPLLLLAAQNRRGAQRCEEGASEAEDVAALYGVVSDERAEVQLVHAEGGGEGAHGREHRAYVVHLALHFGEQEDADDQKETHRSGPDYPGLSAKP